MANVILESIKNHAARTATALSCENQSLTYQDLDRLSSALAQTLQTHLASRTERSVLLLAPSSLEFAVAFVAIQKARAIAVPLQPAHPISELAYFCSDSRATLLLFHPSCHDLASALSETLSPHALACQTIDLSALRTAPYSFDQAPALSNQGCLIIYTSGTTCKPKGVLTTPEALDAQILSLREAWGWNEHDRTLNILPLHHVHGLVNVLCCSLASGAHCELSARFDPDAVWARLTSREISLFMAVPTVYSKLFEHYQKQSPRTRAVWSENVRRLRLMVSGSAALPTPLFDNWEKITGHRLLERYGMTEIGMALSNPLNGVRKPGFVGRPLPGVEVRLSDESGLVIPHEHDGQAHAGEIQVRGPNLFREYWHLPEVTAESFTADGWFRTGDLAERDDSGSYRILGRISQDIIKSGGYKISALELESVLLEHPGIAEIAIVGLNDETWGEIIAAAYAPRAHGAVSPTELESFLKARLAHYKIPRKWLELETLPRNAMGKVLKAQLRSLFKPRA